MIELIIVLAVVCFVMAAEAKNFAKTRGQSVDHGQGT